MSITFSTTVGAIEGFAFTCDHDNGLTDHRIGSYDAARALLQTERDTHGHTGGLALCGDEYRLRSDVHLPDRSGTVPRNQRQQRQCMHLLSLLDFPSQADEDGSLCGSMTAENFLGRALLAQADPAVYVHL